MKLKHKLINIAILTTGLTLSATTSAEAFGVGFNWGIIPVSAGTPTGISVKGSNFGFSLKLGSEMKVNMNTENLNLSVKNVAAASAGSIQTMEILKQVNDHMSVGLGFGSITTTAVGAAATGQVIAGTASVADIIFQYDVSSYFGEKTSKYDIGTNALVEAKYRTTGVTGNDTSGNAFTNMSALTLGFKIGVGL